MNLDLFKIFALLFLFSCVGTRFSAPEGTFYGVLPCADCRGIEFELTLNEDGTYATRMHHLDKGGQVLPAAGTYEIVGRNKVVLGGREGEEGMRHFAIVGEELEMLDVKGDEIETGFRELYILSKEKPENFMVDPTVRYDLKFRGQGNEPFWSVELGFDHRVKLKEMGKTAVDMPLQVDAGMMGELDGVHYQGRNGKTKVSLMIIKKLCADTMADTSYSHEVRVEVSSDEDGGTTVYEGCGDYRGEARLNDIWALVSMNGEELEDKKSIPSIEFQVAERKVFGFSGCNRMSGGVVFFENSLKFGTLATTRRACVDPKVETQFLKIITEREMKYDFDGLHLILTAGDDTLLFKKVD